MVSWRVHDSGWICGMKAVLPRLEIVPIVMVFVEVLIEWTSRMGFFEASSFRMIGMSFQMRTSRAYGACV